MARRWRFIECFEGENREREASELINFLRTKGFKAKVWAPLPQHHTSGHTHVVVLSTFDELLELVGIKKKRAGKDETN